MESRIINIDSQELEYYPEKKILKIVIESPFNSAAKQYRWPIISKGIGIAQKIVKVASQNELVLLIKLEGKVYWIDAWIIESFCEKTNSIYNKQTNTGNLKIYVYPLKQLHEEDLANRTEKQMLIKEYNI